MKDFFTSDILIENIEANGKITIMLNRPSHSWTKNFYQFIFCQVAGVISTNTTYGTQPISTSGTSYHSSADNIMMGGAPKGNPRGLWVSNDSESRWSGCVIGTGTNLESFTSTDLVSIIKSGTGLDQMVFGTTTKYFSTHTNGTVLKLKHDRTFTNNSGNTISVAESGLYGYFYMQTPVTGNYILEPLLINRDTFGAISVANGSSLYVAYTIKLTLPYAIHS